MARRTTSITCTCTSIRRYYVRRRCASFWWVTRCWRPRSAISRRSRPRLACGRCERGERRQRPAAASIDLRAAPGCTRRSLMPLSPAQVSVVLLEPVVADGAEDVEIERVFQRHGTVRHVGGNAQHLPLAHHDFAAADLEAERALKDVGDLLALVVVFRHNRALGEKDLRHHGLVARNDLACDGGAQDLLLHLVPCVEFHVLSSPRLGCVMRASYKNTRNPRKTRGQTGLPANFRQKAPEIHGSLVSPRVRLREQCPKPLSRTA